MHNVPLLPVTALPAGLVLSEKFPLMGLVDWPRFPWPRNRGEAWLLFGREEFATAPFLTARKVGV